MIGIRMTIHAIRLMKSTRRETNQDSSISMNCSQSLSFAKRWPLHLQHCYFPNRFFLRSKWDLTNSRLRRYASHLELWASGPIDPIPIVVLFIKPLARILMHSSSRSFVTSFKRCILLAGEFSSLPSAALPSLPNSLRVRYRSKRKHNPCMAVNALMRSAAHLSPRWTHYHHRFRRHRRHN